MIKTNIAQKKSNLNHIIESINHGMIIRLGTKEIYDILLLRLWQYQIFSHKGIKDGDRYLMQIWRLDKMHTVEVESIDLYVRSPFLGAIGKSID